jgi:hypothetical protein
LAQDCHTLIARDPLKLQRGSSDRLQWTVLRQAGAGEYSPECGGRSLPSAVFVLCSCGGPEEGLNVILKSRDKIFHIETMAGPRLHVHATLCIGSRLAASRRLA